MAAAATGPALAAPVPPPAVTGQVGIWACASCHGRQGEGALNVPRLAGLAPDYLRKQLDDFATGKRRNESMALIAQSLGSAEKRQLADYYAALATPSTARPALGGDLARGERLVLRGDWSRNIPPCMACHGASAFGVGGSFPALAAQHPEYTATQLAAWVSGDRDNAPEKLMNGIALALGNADRRAVADYLATLPPVPATASKEVPDARP